MNMHLKMHVKQDFQRHMLKQEAELRGRASSQENLPLEYPTRSDTNQAVQPRFELSDLESKGIIPSM